MKFMSGNIIKLKQAVIICFLLTGIIHSKANPSVFYILDYGAKFFIHACGQQKDNLGLISSYNVDGLEGVASPPPGDIMLNDAMISTRDGFIITGGISVVETIDLKTREEIFNYVENLFRKMLPYKNRFIFSSRCKTAIDTSWETIKHFRDAWMCYRDIR